MKRILVTNDDGIDSNGILALTEAMKNLGEVWVIAPAAENSSISHALTLNSPLQYKKLDKNKYKVFGTPSDSVYLGVIQIMKDKPDLVVSGINHGQNLGEDVTYSGTVAAAFEGTILEIPSIAFSQRGNDHDNFERAAEYCVSIADMVLKKGLPRTTLLNVNFPDIPIKGSRITRLGTRRYTQYVEEVTDPRGRRYYWIGGGKVDWEDISGSDYEAVRDGNVSITPLKLDSTDYDFMKDMKDWEL